MAAYYNEIDPYAAQWLRNLISAKLIADGVVDERSIEDVKPDELKYFKQCHFFAGIGGWSLALRLAGWPDDEPVWTGSCPCQPFSAAGKSKGFADERHLWPSWFHLIGERRPASVFGEQVASGTALQWIDLVSYDLEALGYAFGSSSIPACSVGAPHIRQRTWWVAEPKHHGYCRPEKDAPEQSKDGQENRIFDGSDNKLRSSIKLGNASGEPCERRPREVSREKTKISSERQLDGYSLVGSEHAGESLGSAIDLGRPQRHGSSADSIRRKIEPSQRESGMLECERPASRYWANAEWIRCRDGKARPIEPGTFPLANGVPNRVGRLRAYGNAIVPQVAAEFIKSTY